MNSLRKRPAVSALTGVALVVVGAVTLYERATWWAPCLADGVIADGYANVPVACLDAMSDTSQIERFPIWMLTMALALVAVIAGTSRARGWVAFALVLVAGPILDPGFIWTDWSTADTMPGVGVLIAAAAIAAGLFVMLPGRKTPQASDGPRDAKLERSRRTQ